MSNHLTIFGSRLGLIRLTSGLRILVRCITPMKEGTSLYHSKFFDSIFMQDFVAKFANECYNVELSLGLPQCF